MKKLAIIFVTLCFLMGCAGKNMVNRTQFMERAVVFDETNKDHPRFDYCLNEYMGCLLINCYDAAQKAEEDPETFWTCCWGCLDEAEECIGGADG